MDEGLEFEAVRLERRDLCQTELPGKDRTGTAEARQRRELGRAVSTQLCAGMNWQIGILRAHAHQKAEVGDDEAVESGEVRRLQRLQRRPDLPVLEQRVQRHVGACSMEMGELDGAHGAFADEVPGEGPRTPALETEIDGVGARRQRRAQRTRLPGRRQ